MTLFGMNIDANPIIDFIRDDAFANVIGFAGGILGAVAFFSQLPKKVKPLFFNSEYTNIYLGTDGSTIEKIESKFVLHNASNKYCIITDVFAKIYESDSYTPDEDIYHATEVSKEDKPSSFTAIYVQPNETCEFDIILGENTSGRSKKRLYEERSYTIEVYFVIDGKRLYMLPRDDTFTIKVKKDERIVLKSLTKAVKREKYERTIKKEKKHISFYKGVINRFLADVGHFIKYKIIKRPIWIVRDIIQWVILRPYFLYLFLKNKVLTVTVFKRYGMRTFRTVVTSGDASKRTVSEKTINKLSKKLNKMIINIKTKNGNDAISIRSNDREIDLSKNKFTLHLYISGDGYINAHELKKESIIQLHFEYKDKYIFSYWNYNNRIVSISEMANIIFNYFIDGSLYSRR
jgi:hypothetical protein